MTAPFDTLLMVPFRPLSFKVVKPLADLEILLLKGVMSVNDQVNYVTIQETLQLLRRELVFQWAQGFGPL